MNHATSSLRNRLVKAAGLAAAGALVIAAPASADEGQILRENADNAIPGSYVVVLDDAQVQGRPNDEIADISAEYGASVEHRYSNTVQGFSAEMTREEALALSTDPAVKSVQQDQVFETLATQSPTPSWGLDRIDQRTLPLNNSFTYPDSAGQNVTAYIIDTGIRTTHSDFGGRASWGINTTGDGQNTDCNGHGTHVAGTVGGTAYGVAKRVKLVAVKVLDCNGSGSYAGVLAGVDWVTANHQPGQPAVANMSLGGSGTNATLENAIRTSIADGVTYAIASGNSNSNACNFTPARTPEAITVNATTNTDARASFSNFGTCTDIFAPGQNITSAWHTSNTATNTISGTSMAAPHVAGAAALVLGATPAATPATVATTLLNNATQNVVTNPGTGSPNRLLNTGTATPPPATCAPVTNGTDIAVPDLGTAQSPLAVSGCNRAGSTSAKVSVNIVHTFIGDLVVELIAPDGSVYVLHNRAGGSADNINQTYTVNLGSEAANGTWNLRVRDAARADIGYINSWTLEP